MNRFEITGKILYDPIYVQEGDGASRLIRLTIKSTDKNVAPEMYLKLECIWTSPPNRYWEHPDLEIGTLVYMWGPLYTGPTTLHGTNKMRPPYLHIKFFDIRTTRKDFERMKSRLDEKGRKH